MRKFWLGETFIVAGTFLAWAGIREHSDLIGLGVVIGAVAGGVFTIVWGNAQEWKAKSNGKSE